MPIAKFASTTAAVLALLTGAAGFQLGTVRQHAAPARLFLGAESLTAPRSFSEVENARTVLEGLARQFLYDWGREWVSFLQEGPSSSDPERREDLMNGLRSGMDEFEGTGQEFLLAERYLMVCAQQKKFNWWLDAYLKVLYQHPSHRLVSAFALAAVPFAREAGREADLEQALAHLQSIPPAQGLSAESGPLVQAAALRLSEPMAGRLLWAAALCPEEEPSL